MPVEPPLTPWEFPDPTNAPDDLVCAGADLEPGTLLHAYRSGFFPMPVGRRRNQNGWFSPNPRGIIPLDGLQVSRSMRRSDRRFQVRWNERFDEVMRRCGDPRRPHGWINEPFVRAYGRLHDLGWAHSVEVYEPSSGALVGGLYGLRVGRLFAGESMFHTATDASKVALMHLVDRLNADGVHLLDVQWTTPHLRSLGAIDVSRADYLKLLREANS